MNSIVANSYFSFKQFTVHQERCAMKVCTDACLFGAWSVQQMLTYNPAVKNILDIGTGTGLLSLMLAQNFTVPIVAIEINADAALQAKENFRASGWENIQAHHTSLADFPSDKKYDFIIVNPPFFEGDLLSPDRNRNAAMHDSYLTLESLLQSVKPLLSDKGYVAVLLPFSRNEYFKQLLENQAFQVKATMCVKQSINHDFFRVMFLIGLHSTTEPQTCEISIYDGRNQYTPDFKNLLKSYYLAF